MTKHELNAWIRLEHEKVEELANRLREKTAIVPRANMSFWISEVCERFDHFRAHLVKHMALEEQDGYLPAVVERRPALSGEVDRLHHEHQELRRIMDTLHQAVHELAAKDRLLARDCCCRIDQLLCYVDHHEELENNLVTLAFTQDIGTKD